MLFALQIDLKELRLLVAPASDPEFDQRPTLEEVEAATWLEADLRFGAKPSKLQARIRQCEEWLGCGLLEAEGLGRADFSLLWPQTAEACCAAVERLQALQPNPQSLHCD